MFRFLTFYIIPWGLASLSFGWIVLVLLFSDPFSDQSDIVSWWRRAHPRDPLSEKEVRKWDAYWKAKREGGNPSLPL